MSCIKTITHRFVDFRYQKGDTHIYNSMQIHPYCELYLFKNGSVEYISNRVRRMVSPNQLIIIPAGEYHYFHVLGDIDSYERCVLDIHPGFFGYNLFEAVLKEKGIINLSRNDRLIQNFNYLVDCADKMESADCRAILSSVATDILYNIKYSQPSSQKNVSKQSPFLRELIAYVDDNYKSTISLNALAERFNYSVSHISHEFKENFGISIKNYILQKRLNAIHVQIQQGVNAQKASQEYGFSNYTTFFRLYKNAFGAPPSSFKQNVK